MTRKAKTTHPPWLNAVGLELLKLPTYKPVLDGDTVKMEQAEGDMISLTDALVALMLLCRKRKWRVPAQKEARRG